MKLVRDMPWPVADLRIDWTDGDPIEELAALWARYKPQLEDFVARALDPANAPPHPTRTQPEPGRYQRSGGGCRREPRRAGRGSRGSRRRAAGRRRGSRRR